MQTRQAHRLFAGVTEARGSLPLRIVINGMTFPIKQRIVIHDNVTYIIADTDPNKSTVCEFPWQRSKRRALRQ